MFVQLEHVQTNQAPGKVADLFIKIILISFMCNDLFAISLKLFHILTFTQIKIKTPLPKPSILTIYLY